MTYRHPGLVAPLLVATAIMGHAALPGPAGAHEQKVYSAGEPGNPIRPAHLVRISMREETGSAISSPTTERLVTGLAARVLPGQVFMCGLGHEETKSDFRLESASPQ